MASVELVHSPGDDGAEGVVGAARVAYVHEWLTDWGGSEDVVRQMLEVQPGHVLFALIDFLSDADRAKFGGIPIHTTFLQRAPFARSRFWHYLPFTPLAVETHDARDADIVVSSSHAFAKGVLTTAEQLHVSYVHSPMRYAWDLHHEYLADYGLGRGAKGWLARYIFHRLRLWDRQTANNVDLLLANSQHVARRIWRTYRRRSLVVYPPVSTDRYVLVERKADHYVTVSRLVSYKRIDIMLHAFREMPGRKLFVIGDGPEAARLRAICPPNVTLLGWQPHDVVQQHVGSARAFLFAAQEDFGISPVEAQACGTPVIAFGVGGARETVRDARTADQPTGLLFDEQSPSAVRRAVEDFDRVSIDPAACRRWATRFGVAQFRQAYAQALARAWSAWQAEPACVEQQVLGAMGDTGAANVS